MAKGSEFEREISKMLSKWWSGDDERDDIFWRTSQSGGRATSRAKVGKKTHSSYGDILAVDPDGEALVSAIVLELKRGYKKWSFLDVLDAPERKGKKSPQPIENFISQVQQSVEDDGNGKFPVIISRRDGRKHTISLPKRLYMGICACYSTPDVDLLIFKPKLGLSWYTMPLVSFLGWCQPEYFKEAFSHD